jgi:hypothetical protein
MSAAANERTLLQNGTIELWSNPQPVSAKDPMTGILIGRITLNGATYVPAAGGASNGITPAAPVLENDVAVLKKPAGELWQFKVLAAGTVNSARYIGNPVDNNSSSTTLHRLDMSVSLPSGTGELKMAKLTYAVDEVGDVQSFTLTFGNPLAAAA